MRFGDLGAEELSAERRRPSPWRGASSAARLRARLLPPPAGSQRAAPGLRQARRRRRGRLRAPSSRPTSATSSASPARPFRTKTDELTIEAQELRLLGKSLRPLPEKWHGLTDVEARYRQRYLDLIANDEVRATFRLRARSHPAHPRFLRRARLPRGRDADDAAGRRRRRGAAVRHASQRARHGPLPAHRSRALPQAPAGRRLRSRLRDQPHLPQRGRLDAATIPSSPCSSSTRPTRPTRISCSSPRSCSSASPMRSLGTRMLPYGDARDRPHAAVAAACRFPSTSRRGRRLPLEAVLALDLARARDGGGAGSDSPLAAGLRTPTTATGAAGYLLTDLFEAVAEPELIQPTFVYEYPVAVSPLARRNAERPQFVDRFELFIAGARDGNAFSELNDPDDQRARFEAQLRRAPPATRRRTRWTRTSSAPSSTACRPPPARASASIGW